MDVAAAVNLVDQRTALFGLSTSILTMTRSPPVGALPRKHQVAARQPGHVAKKRRRQVPTMSGRRLHGVREPRGRSGAGPRCRRQGRTTPCRCRPWRCRGSTTLRDTRLTRWFAKRHSVLLNVLSGQGPERFCATPCFLGAPRNRPGDDCGRIRGGTVVPRVRGAGEETEEGAVQP